jgi:hypothetical protein
MERGDLAAVLIGLVLVIILTVVLSPPAPSAAQATGPVVPTRVPTIPVTPVTVTTGPISTLPVPSPATTRRILYTSDYSRFPVRYLPGDMGMYGSSDAEWQYKSSVAFAYIEEDHGGITEPFTVPYPLWRMTSTVYAIKTPERARFRMILVDEQSGLVLEGAEIRFTGSVTKTVATGRRPVYLVIATENVDRFTINLEIPSDLAE